MRYTMAHCSTLQRPATHYNALQHFTSCCNTLTLDSHARTHTHTHTRTHTHAHKKNAHIHTHTLAARTAFPIVEQVQQQIAAHFNTLQHAGCNTLQHPATPCNTLQLTDYTTLQHPHTHLSSTHSVSNCCVGAIFLVHL